MYYILVMFPLEKQITICDVIKWKKNKLKNPLTNRKIKKNKITYNNFKKLYNNFFPLGFDFLDTIDDKDPITLKKFWIIENSNKKLVYINLDNLQLYIDINNNKRCIEKTTLQYLKTYNINYHPKTLDVFPSKIWDKVEKIIIKESIKCKSERIFKMFDSISIFIDNKEFLNLNLNELNKLNYEIKDIYYQNISLDDRKIIDKKDGNNIFKLSNKQLVKMDKENIQEYLLNQIEYLLNVNIKKFKYIIKYILLGSLGLVIPKISKQYPDFKFSF